MSTVRSFRRRNLSRQLRRHSGPRPHTTQLKPAAPPVYRPQTQTTHLKAPPPVYRPQPQTTQPKMAAPPVYRPQTIQAKPTHNGPPVYRPTPLTRPAVSNKLPPAPIIPSIQGSAQAKPVATDVLQQRAVGTRNLLSSSNTSAHAHGGRTEGKAATHTTHPAKPSSAGLIAPQIGARSTTIQREIYKFEGDTWVLERIGTKGGFTPPARPDEGMLYFNTVTGEQGPEIKNVEAGLADLMIMKGSLNDAKIAVPWPEYLWNGLQNGTTDGSVTTLGTNKAQVR